MPASSAHAEDHSLRGAIDRPAVLTIRDIIEEMEPLATAQPDDYLHPSVLEVSLEDGLCDADEARIDVQWTTQDDYKFHYTDTADVNFRWGNHPHGGDYIHVTGTEHYHPPPDASSDLADVENSCIIHPDTNRLTRRLIVIHQYGFSRSIRQQSR